MYMHADESGVTRERIGGRFFDDPVRHTSPAGDAFTAENGLKEYYASLVHVRILLLQIRLGIDYILTHS